MKSSISVFLFLLLSLFVVSCDQTPELTQDEEWQLLQTQLSQIEGFAQSVPCTDPTDWSYIAYGSKPCGGPWGFIPYALTTNISELERRLNLYAQAEESYNQRWGIFSDCSIPPSPTSIICQNGIAVLQY